MFEAEMRSKTNKDDSKRVAVKIESVAKTPTNMEVQVLQCARENRCRHVPLLYDYVGSFDIFSNFLPI